MSSKQDLNSLWTHVIWDLSSCLKGFDLLWTEYPVFNKKKVDIRNISQNYTYLSQLISKDIFRGFDLHWSIKKQNKTKQKTAKIQTDYFFGGVFMGVSNFVGYFMPKPSLEKKQELFDLTNSLKRSVNVYSQECQ